MAVTAFQTNSETKLAAMAANLLAKDATFDDSTAQNENAQILVWLYQLVKVIRVRQRAAIVNTDQMVDAGTIVSSKRDRIFRYVGEHTHFAMMQLCAMIQPVYNELYAAFNNVDNPATDSPFGTNLGDNGTGPVGGPLHGFGSGG